MSKSSAAHPLPIGLKKPTKGNNSTHNTTRRAPWASTMVRDGANNWKQGAKSTTISTIPCIPANENYPETR